MKNIEFEKPMIVKEQISYVKEKIVKKIILQNIQTTITLLAFSKGMQLPTHASMKEVLLYIVEGTACVTILDIEHILHEGQSIAIQANARHAVFAQEAFKMVVIVDAN